MKVKIDLRDSLLGGENLQYAVHVLLGCDAFGRREEREQGYRFSGEVGRVRLVVLD